MKVAVNALLESDSIVSHSPDEFTIISKTYDPLDARIVDICRKKNLAINVDHVGPARVVSFVATKGMLAVRLKVSLKEMKP